MKYYLILVLSIGSMHAMNKQVIPIDDAHAANSEKIVEDAVSGSSSSGSNVAAPGIQTATVLSDLELCRRAFPSINPSGHLIPHLAEHLRGKQGDIEAGDMVNFVVQAANQALDAKHQEVNSRFTKTHVGYATGGTTIIVAIITALASVYQCQK